MTQIVFLLFEDCSKPEDSDMRYCVAIHFSPGVRCREELLTTQGEAAVSLSGSSTPSSSPSKTAPIHSGMVTSSGAASQATSEDNGEVRPKEVHIVRRYSEYVYPVQRNIRFKKASIPWTFSPVVRPDQPGRHNNVKSYSETEITFQDRKRKIGVGSNVHLPVYHSSSGGILDSTVPTQGHLDASDLSNGGRMSLDMSMNKSLVKAKPSNVTGSKQGVSFLIGGKDDEEEEREPDEGKHSSNAENIPLGISDNLASSDSSRVSANGMSGNHMRK